MDGMTPAPPFADAEVARAFAAFPGPARDGLLSLRALIFATARATPGVGALHETLKWGQPAYLTPETRSGTTLRLGVPKSGGYAIYAHCQTTVITGFRDMFGDEFAYDGNRAVLFADGAAPPADRLSLLVSRALTYRLKRR